MSLYSEIRKKPVKNLERKFIDLVRQELDVAAECATMYFEHDYTANPSERRTREELENALSAIRSDLLTSIGELSNKDKYIYLLQVKEWLFDLVSAKNNILNSEWHYQLHSTSKKANEAFDKNMKILQHAFKGELLLIYDEALKDLDLFHSMLSLKYEEGELTNQSPKEIAEYIITYKPQFTLSKDLTLQKLKGKEITILTAE